MMNGTSCRGVNTRLGRLKDCQSQLRYAVYLMLLNVTCLDFFYKAIIM